MNITWHDISLNTTTNVATFNDQTIKLGRVGGRLFEYMLKNAGKLCTYQDLSMGVWGKPTKSTTIQACFTYLVTAVRPFYDLSKILVLVQCCGYRLAWPGEVSYQDAIVHGSIKVHPTAMEVLVGEQQVRLRPKEYQLLLCLLQIQKPICSYAELASAVYGHDFYGYESIRVQVGSLNRKLRDHVGKDVVQRLSAQGFRLLV